MVLSILLQVSDLIWLNTLIASSKSRHETSLDKLTCNHTILQLHQLLVNVFCLSVENARNISQPMTWSPTMWCLPRILTGSRPRLSKHCKTSEFYWRLSLSLSPLMSLACIFSLALPSSLAWQQLSDKIAAPSSRLAHKLLRNGKFLSASSSHLLRFMTSFQVWCDMMGRLEGQAYKKAKNSKVRMQPLPWHAP